MRARHWALLAALAALALLSLILSLWCGTRLAAWLVGTAAWLRAQGPMGGVSFAALVVAVTLIGIIPGALLGLAGGAIFGLATGFIVTGAGILLGAIAAFALSRSLLRPLIAQLLRGRVAAIDSIVAADGWRLVALLRLSPIMPFSIASYALGLSGVRPADYIAGTLASLPLLLGYVLIGTLSAHSLTATTTVKLTLLALGTLATLALTIYFGRLLARAIR